MTSPVGSVQGLASGIQWQDMVDQLATIDQQRELDPITAAITASQAQSDAWTSYQTVAAKLGTAVANLGDGTAIDSFKVDVASSPSTGRSLLSATTSSGAAPGTYQVEVVDIARAEKLSGGAFASASSALGLAAGDIAINGVKVSITAADSLNNIRDKINAVNTGASPSGVTASVLGTADGSSRLVLSSDAAGAHGLELIDSASPSGVLHLLGILDGTYAGGVNADGTATSGGFTSSTISISQLLGLTTPGVTTIRAGNRTISIDLAVDSLASIAAKITAAGIGARTTTATENGADHSRLQVDAALSATPSAADASVPDPNSLRVLQLLGVMQGGRAAEGQSVASTALTDATSAPATGATLLSDVSANGASANIQAGDSVTISGKRGDGTAVSLNFTVAPGSTMDDLLAQINGPTGFGGGSRGAVASLGADGKIHLADSTLGASQLTMSMSVNKSVANGGGTTSIGAFSVESVGRLREVTQGSDAHIRVDGVLLTRSTNSVSDAISGVTLNLQQAEANTTIGVTVSRDTSGALAAVNAFASAYNALTTFVKTNTATGGDLANSTALKASARAFTNTLLSDVLGAPITRTALVGIALDKNGVLQVDSAAFTAALQSNSAAVRQLFALSGTVSGSGLEYAGASDKTQSGTYNVVINTAAAVATATGSAATFPFVAGATPTHLMVTDSASGTTDGIVLANGDDANAVAAKLNSMFATRRMLLSATNVGGQVSISSTQYGALNGFTLAYDAGDTTSASQIGLAAGSFTGVDVAGTINGVAAIGNGQTLTGAIGDASDGLVLRYTGSILGAIGATTLTAGVGAQVARQVSLITRAGDGTVALSVDALSRSMSTKQARADDVSARLARRKAAMLLQFQAMEAAIQRIQAQGASITSSLNALTTLQSTK
jgi:flagellar hook-associated protein 2